MAGCLSQRKSGGDTVFLRPPLNSDNDVQTIYEQNKCVAAVGVVRTKFSYNGIEIPSAIGSYLCVDYACREKGYSVAVGVSCARYCSELGADLLIGWEMSPKLRLLYESSGSFLYRDYVKRTTICRADTPACEINGYRVETTQRNIMNEYNDFIRGKCNNYMIHSEKAWGMLGREADFFWPTTAMVYFRVLLSDTSAPRTTTSKS